LSQSLSDLIKRHPLTVSVISFVGDFYLLLSEFLDEFYGSIQFNLYLFVRIFLFEFFCSNFSIKFFFVRIILLQMSFGGASSSAVSDTMSETESVLMEEPKKSSKDRKGKQNEGNLT
jgi:hypothetical protein